jgi:uncharacterized Zn finger protein
MHMETDTDYVEQYCSTCQDETDQLTAAESTTVRCLRCGNSNRYQVEDERVAALLHRVTEDDSAFLDSWRETAGGAPNTPPVARV